MNNDYLVHFGVKGVKWGVRRKQKAEYEQAKKESKTKYREDRKSGKSKYRKEQGKLDTVYEKKVNKLDNSGEKRDKLELISRSKEANKRILDQEAKRKEETFFDYRESTNAVLVRMRNRELSSLESELNKGRPIREELDISSYLLKRSDYKVKKSDYIK